jgi:hypothetical protein
MGATDMLASAPPVPNQAATPGGFRLLLQFAYLQGLDILTTLAFLLSGVKEGNPLVRFAMRQTGSPLAGLLILKLLGIALGLYCWRAARFRLLDRVVIFYSILVAYNLACLILGLVANGRA